MICFVQLVFNITSTQILWETAQEGKPAKKVNNEGQNDAHILIKQLLKTRKLACNNLAVN